MKTSCIERVPKDTYVVLKKSFLSICDSCFEAAILLAYFESWHNFKINAIEQNKHLNDVAEKHGDSRTQDETLFQYHTSEKIYEECMGMVSQKGILKGRRKLVDLGYVSEHKNPNPKYSFDNTVFYLFHADVINIAITKLKSNQLHFSQNAEVHTGKMDGRSIQNGDTVQAKWSNDTGEMPSLLTNVPSNVPSNILTNQSSSGENFSELVFTEFRKQKPDLPQTALIDEVNLFEKKFKGQTIGNLPSLVSSWVAKVDWSRYSQPPENGAPEAEKKPLDIKESTDTVKELNPNLTPMQCYDIAAKIHRRFGDKKYDNPKQFVIDTITQMQRPDYVEKVTMTYHAIISEIKYLTKGGTDGWQRYVADKVYETWKDKPVQSFEELMESFVYDAKNKRNLFATQ